MNVPLGLTTAPCQEPPSLHTEVSAIPAVSRVHITVRLRKASALATLVQLSELQRFRQRAGHHPRTRARRTLASRKTPLSTCIAYCHPTHPQNLPRSTAVAGLPTPIMTALPNQHHNRDTSAPAPLEVGPPHLDRMHPQH
jgi:hypothetical protein